MPPTADAGLARIDKATRVPPTPFVKAPPMTLDDELQFESVRLAHGVPLVASRFDSMTGATTGLALRLDGVPADELRYLSLLPVLLTQAGVIDNGRPVPYEEMSERLRREILGLGAGFAGNARTGRVELVLRGSGVGLEESRRALDWMARVLHAPDWRAENLPRLRDLVDQELAALRNTVQRPEEYWVSDPADAWRMQRRPSWLASASFLTRTHNALRLRWQLLDPAPGDGQALADFLTRLAEVGRGLDRPRLKALLADGKAPGWEALTAAQRDARRRGGARSRTEPGRDAGREPGRRLRLPRAGPARRPGAAGPRGAGTARGVAPAPAAQRRRADVPGLLRRDARRARAAARVVRGPARRRHRLRRRAAERRGADRRAAARSRRAGGAAARRPACAEQAGRRDPHLGARGALRRRGRQGQAARLAGDAPLRRRRLARRLLQDRRRRPRLQQRAARLGLERPRRLLRRAHARAAADGSLRHRRDQGRAARPLPSAST